MTLPSPNLDDRTFQDLVREARANIPRYCPEWTDHNLSDPGITLIELFAWMVETLLYRVNQVPEKNYIKFMELMGIQLEPPEPAKVDVTFRLSTSQPEAVTIPRGTQVATVRTETRDAITFTTDEDLIMFPPNLLYALTTFDEAVFEDRMAAFKNPDRFISIFQDSPQEGDALYLGFEGNLAAQTLALSLKCRSEGIGIDPNDPPLSWEVWDSDIENWVAIRVEKDTTGGLNTNGRILLHIPYGCSRTQVNRQRACWIRCRAVTARSGQQPYSSSPKVGTVTAESVGGTVLASHALRVMDEILGKSNGTAGQKFNLHNGPVLHRTREETIAVQNDEGEFEAWREVEDFSASGPDDPHFVCDSVSGEIQFGPCIKQPSGQERQYGKIPPSGRQIYFTSYRFGGGTIGNVGPKTITVLKSSIPYIASVINWQAARGGTEPESMQLAKMRAPQVLRARTRAVTSDDFEQLAIQASSLVARAKCIQPGSGKDVSPDPGTVTLMLVPVVSQSDQPIPAEELSLTRLIRDEVQAYLDQRRLLGTRLIIRAPKYVPVSVTVRVKGNVGTDFGQVADEIARKLYRYIHPVSGGSGRSGWPFGRGISVSEIHAAIQGTADFDYVEDVRLFPVDPVTGERQEATGQISVSIDSLVCSHVHEVVVG